MNDLSKASEFLLQDCIKEFDLSLYIPDKVTFYFVGSGQTCLFHY